jgi:hypothetical protein
MTKATKNKYTCLYCGKEYVDTNFYNSNSEFYSSIEKIPYCKQCIEGFYQFYFDKYTNEGCLTPERKAVKRLCMAFDIYYREDVFNSSLNKIKEGNINISPMGQYMKVIQLFQYNRNKETYENTITKEEERELIANIPIEISDDFKADEATIEFFGTGFTDSDYKFLKREYEDWTARHECKTKTQEEIFKDICFNRLQNLKALQKGEETKDITAAFQKMLDSGKLQPKQNSGDTTADNQTFGTLIDKWENTRPLPEIDEELKDVDKIGYYIDTFFKGHTCRMLNVKNAFSNLYSSMMKKFTVNKPEYNLDEDDYDSELNFDTIFGDKPSDLSDE